MKKITLTLFALLLLSVAGYAQGFYFRTGLGYAFPQAGQTMDGSGTPYSGSQTYHSNQTQTYSIKGISFSAGFQGVVGLGYKFNDHIGVQLDAGVGISNKKYTLNINNVSLGGVQSDVSIIQQAKNPVIVMPSLILQSGGDKVNIYSRIGIALPLNSKITLDEVVSNAPNTGTLTVDDFTFQIKNSFSVGFTGAAGVQYKISDKISIWGELSLLSLSLYIKEADLRTVTENGQNVPLSYVSGPHVVQYSKNIVIDSTGANQPTYSQPFSNIGINVGINLTLSRYSRHRMGGENNKETPNRPTGPYRRR